MDAGGAGSCGAANPGRSRLFSRLWASFARRDGELKFAAAR